MWTDEEERRSEEACGNIGIARSLLSRETAHRRSSSVPPRKATHNRSLSASLRKLIVHVPLRLSSGQPPASIRGVAEMIIGKLCRGHENWQVTCILFGPTIKGGDLMPERKTLERARKDKREGKAPSTQAGEFVREEIEHVRQGKHGARSTKQAIAIGLSKARRAGVKLKPPRRDQASSRTRTSAASAYRAGQHGAHRKTSAKRSRATLRALKREPYRTVSKKALSAQARDAAARRRRRASA